MKTFRLLRNGAMALLAVATMTACSDDDDNDSLIINVEDAVGITFNEDGYWDKVYDASTAGFDVNGMTFSHVGSATEWAGVTYYSWYGFCPTKSTDNNDYTGGDWISHQWGAITGGGVSGSGSSYILGFWNSSESTDRVPMEPACSITYSGKTFNPEEIYVTNSAYAYYSLKNGSAYNKQFAAGDWCILHIYGVKGGVVTGKVEVYLANGSDILNTWKKVDLEPLGDVVDMIYFQITSSDTGDWGMNNPAYFCLGRLKIDLD